MTDPQIIICLLIAATIGLAFWCVRWLGKRVADAIDDPYLDERNWH